MPDRQILLSLIRRAPGLHNHLRVPTCRFNQRVSRLNPPFTLRLLDHPQRYPILDASTGVEILQLGVYRGFDA